MTNISGFTDVLARIGKARKNLLRQSPFTKLIMVSKGRSESEIRPLLEAGHRAFGENRVQEAEAKWPALKRDFPGVGLHMIGPLQINKVREAVALFDAFHSLDRPKLAHALKVECEHAGRSPELFVQVNTGREPQKSGVLPENAPALVALARELGLAVQGLMCIPPHDEPPEKHFALLAKLADELALPYLSMGMSHDFETAIRLGATHVRVGTAIFGARR